MATDTATGTGAKVLAGLGVVATVVGIVAAVHGMVKDDPPPPPPQPQSGTTIINPPAVGGVSAPAADTPVYGSIMVPLNLGTVYSWPEPMFGSAPEHELEAGTQVQLICSVQGQTISNLTTQSSLWYWTEYGYIPDSYLNTGTFQSQRASC